MAPSGAAILLRGWWWTAVLRRRRPATTTPVCLPTFQVRDSTRGRHTTTVTDTDVTVRRPEGGLPLEHSFRTLPSPMSSLILAACPCGEPAHAEAGRWPYCASWTDAAEPPAADVKSSLKPSPRRCHSYRLLSSIYWVCGARPLMLFFFVLPHFFVYFIREFPICVDALLLRV